MQQVASTAGFALGLDWSRPVENIDIRSLVEARQCEYDREDGALRTVAGVRSVFEHTGDIESLYYDTYRSCWYFTSGRELFRTNFQETTKLGELTGHDRPKYHAFDSKILIASGDKLQAISGSGTLTTILNSPICHFVSSHSGSVIVANTNSHRITWSAIGDIEGWEVDSNNAAGAQYVEVGYKDPGAIIGIDFLSKAIIVYKAYGRVYQVIGNPHEGTLSVLPLSQTGYCSGSTLNVDDRSYYLGDMGFMSFAPTNTYADIQPFETGLAINPWLLKRVTGKSRMWHIPNRKQVWILPDSGREIFMYHYLPRFEDGRGVFTSRLFTHTLQDVSTVDKEVYIAYGSKIGILDESIDTDDGEQIQTSIISGNRVATRLFLLLMSYNFISHNLIPGHGFITISNKKAKRIEFKSKATKLFYATDPLVSATNKLFSDEYTKVFKVGGGANRNLQIKLFVAKGAISLRQFDYVFEEV